MPVIFHEKSKEFHLYNNDVSYIIGILENNQLGNLYYGKRLRDREDFSHLSERDSMPRALTAYNGMEPCRLSMQVTRQEYPSYGTTDYRYPAFEILQENGSKITNFEYVSHNIFAGKKKIEPLPATYVESDSEATTLELTLYDKLIDTELVLSYTIYEDYAAITRNARFTYKGDKKITLTEAMSANVDLPDSDFEMIHLSGAWSRERYVKTRKLEQGVQSVYSLRGASSSEHNPFIAIKRPDANEMQGEVYGFSFVYSGNFLAQIEVCTNDTTRIMMGIHPHMFNWVLGQGESFQTPEVVMVYSDNGLNKMSQTFHELYRTRLVRGVWRDKVRPVLLNNWEATYMDFTEETVLNIAKKAKEVGVELFVLDDGWFGARNTDLAGLGDWYVNTKKLPDGITGLSKKVEEMGMKFGLWIEPEMVNKDSDLYRAHPDWLLSTPDRFESPSRFQHVLDFSRKEVVDYIHGLISKVIREASISYIKWDMNRYITECYSRAEVPEKQGQIMHRYILGVYDLYTRLTSEFPEILFESCASGGARFDPGILYFAPQTWCSDDTDANERLKIQYGTSFVYPISSIGAHVSEVPNQQLNRITPLKTRGNVAFFGAFGYELDLNKMSEAEITEVKEQIKYFKAHRELFQQGVFTRLKSPFEGNETAWIMTNKEKTEAIAGYYQCLNRVNAGWLRFKLSGLDESKLYKVYMNVRAEENNSVPYDVLNGQLIGEYYGDELMNAGICIDRAVLYKIGGDFASILYYLKA